MKYYKVKPEYDNRTRYKRTRGGTIVNAGILVENELYTAAEFKRLANKKEWFEEVEVKKNDTYKFFGARFAM